METSEIIHIRNPGKSVGKFKWETESKIFFISPRSGLVPGRFIKLN